MRLIDADLLEMEYSTSMSKDNHRTFEGSMIHLQEHRHIIHMLRKAPTVSAISLADHNVEVNKLVEENERLKGLLTEWKSQAYKLSDSIDSAKSEAIKKFAERLKTEQSFYDGQETRIYLTEKDLDNLVKEMVGEG